VRAIVIAAAVALVLVLVGGRADDALADDGELAPRRAASDIDAARERALTPDFQRRLPGDEAGAGSAAGSAAAKLRKPAEPRTPAIDTRAPRDEAGALGSLMTFLLWGLVIVVAALLAVWFAGALWKGEDHAELAPDPDARAEDAETAAMIARPLGDADELARRGDYAEAIHTLLLRTLEELVRVADVRVERSHTSREILARVPLRPDARDALAGLITAVEVTHFGDAPAAAADYDRCREQFHRFAAALRASGLAAVRRDAGAVLA
jgi:hypothetical protein